MAGLCTAAFTAACTSAASGRHASTTSSRTASTSAPSPTPSGVPPTALRIQRTTWHLARPLSREIVFAVDGSLEVAGGLLPDGTTTAAVTSIDPRTRVSRELAPLAVATHDAAGATLGDRRFLFGGGASVSEATVQQVAPSDSPVPVTSLPHPRSDLAGVVVGGAAYLLGGYDGTTWAGTILRTTDGRHFTVATRLPVPVRYAAVAVLGELIWVFGGQAQAGATAVVQRIDVTSGHAEVIAQMRHPLTDASAVVLEGQVLLCGGSVSGTPTSAVQQFDPRTLQFTQVGNLPQPLQDAGSAVVNGVAYLLGGETPRPTASVETLQFVTPATTGPATTGPATTGPTS